VSRWWKIGIGAVAAVVAFNVALALIHDLSGGTPGGPPSSSYSTSTSGAAAYASLLGRAGHRVDRLRRPPSDANLEPTATAIIVDPGPVSAADARALQRFVKGGGRLVIGGLAGAWLRRVVPGAPDWSPTAPATVRELAPAPELARVRRVDAPGAGSWVGGSALPLLGDRDRALLSVAGPPGGRVLLLANAAPLQNRLLAHADNARLGLALAGPPRRRVVFLESYHGYSSATGLAAIPGRWWVAFGLLGLAALTLMVASGRRFGPPQAVARDLAPARREYVESLAGALARSQPREAALRPVRARIRQLIGGPAGLGHAGPTTPSNTVLLGMGQELRDAAVRRGVPEQDADVLARPARTDADVIAIGRVLEQVERQSRP
jgi:Domain of unknown function (DUF4350)